MEAMNKPIVTRSVPSYSALPILPRLHSPVAFRPSAGDLYKHRQETAALRDVWRSLASKRQKRQQRNGAQSVKLYLNKPAETSTADTASQSWTNEKPENSSKSDSKINTAGINNVNSNAEWSPENQPPPTHLPKVDATIGLFKSFQRSATMTSPLRHNDVKSPLPYHTAITRRPSRTCSPLIQALTLPYEPLPHLMERRAPRSRTAAVGPVPGRDIKHWQNQIVKVVPTRPTFFQPLLTRCDSPGVLQRSSRTTLRYPYTVTHLDPSCHFYKSWVKAVDKDFVISPEWASERAAGSALKKSMEERNGGMEKQTDSPSVLRREETWCT